MTITENTETTEERVVLIPEVSVPASATRSVERAQDLLEQLRPQLKELTAATNEARHYYNQATALITGAIEQANGEFSTDAAWQIAAQVTGWDALWQAISAELGDPFHPDVLLSGEEDEPHTGTTA